MNEKIKELAEQARKHFPKTETSGEFWVFDEQLFAKLIVQECRTVINDVYHKTPLELCGPLLTVDEEIMKHFYRVDLK